MLALLQGPHKVKMLEKDLLRGVLHGLELSEHPKTGVVNPILRGLQDSDRGPCGALGFVPLEDERFIHGHLL